MAAPRRGVAGHQEADGRVQHCWWGGGGGVRGEGVAGFVLVPDVVQDGDYAALVGLRGVAGYGDVEEEK